MKPEPTHLAAPTNLPAKFFEVTPSPLESARAMPAGNNGGAEMQQSTLLEYLRILSRHKLLCVLAISCGAALGLGVSLVMKPVYEARTSIEIYSFNEDFLNLRQTIPVTNTDLTAETSDQQTQIKLLQSESLIKRVITQLLNENLDGQRVDNSEKTIHALSPETERDLLQEAAKSFTVRASGRTRIIDIRVTSRNPNIAAAFANTLDEQFIKQSLEARGITNQRTSDWLNHQIEEVRSKLERSQEALQSYAQKSGLLFTDDKNNVSDDSLRHAQLDLEAATADRIAKQVRYELTSQASAESLPDIINDTGLQASRAKLMDLDRQLAEMESIYNPEYSKLKRARAEQASLQTAIDKEGAAVLNRVHNEYNESIRKEQLLRAVYTSAVKEMTADGNKSIQYSILKREVESNRQLYDNLLQQLKAASVATAMVPSNLRVVDPAEVPSKPYSPNFPINIASGAFMGLMAGVLFVLLRERTDSSIQEPGDLQSWSDMLELGAIPSVGHEGLGRLRISAEQAVIKPTPIDEAFRSVRASLLSISESRLPVQVLVLTSASVGEGKTTVTGHLGVTLAEIGKRVLIVDGNLRQPRLHTLFDSPNNEGLSTWLTEPSSSNSDWRSLIDVTRVRGLHVLPSGPPTDAGPELFYSSRFRLLLASLREEYDLVLIDTPPCVPLTDARVIARSADAVVFITRSHKTTREALSAASKQFFFDGSPVLGAILNDWKVENSRNPYHKQSYSAQSSPEES